MLSLFEKRKHWLFSHSLSGFRTGVARQTLRMLAIFDGLHRTAADAGHAMRAVAAPDRMSCFQFNIFQRTLLNTLTAGNAGFGSCKFLCVDKHRIKQIVDDAAVQFVLHRSRQFRKTFTFFDTLCGLLDDRVSCRKLLLRFLWRRCRKHRDIIFRHHDRKTSPGNPSSSVRRVFPNKLRHCQCCRRRS